MKLKVPKTFRSTDTKVARAFTKTELTRVLRLAELVGRLKERQRTYQVDKRKSFNGIIKTILDLEFQLSACPCLESSLRRRYGNQVENLTAKDYWVFFRSPPETWRKMCGRQGWFVFDYEKLNTKAFIVTILN
ncbi:MAG: hypothetical protein ACKODS_03375 [Methylophilaceae bacterium]